LSNHQTQVTPARPAAGGGPQTRASDADRDHAAGLLNAAFAEGRLTADEHGDRLSAACTARTWQDLRRLTGDLPATAGTATERPPAPGMSAGADRCLLCVLLVACPPAGIALWFLSRRRSRTYPGQPPAEASGSAVAGDLPRPGRPVTHRW
jgi:hypothetical protein